MVKTILSEIEAGFGAAEFLLWVDWVDPER